MNVFVNDRRVRVEPARAIGKGGEADVFDIGGGLALKLFKGPDHPDYAGLPEEQQAARARIALHQQKLRAFPRGLPDRIALPLVLATDGRGSIVGYTMRLVGRAEPLLRFSQSAIHDQMGPGAIVKVLCDLYRTVAATHAFGVVLGDFNDLNVLYRDQEAFLIDADSFQFGPFPCPVYTERFVDPLLCNASASAPEPVRPFTTDSDWYAYAVMVTQSLLCTSPWGGVHRPADPARRIPPAARPLRRLTVFSPDVVYPKPAVPWHALPDDLLQHLHEVFERDRRGPFPVALLEALWFERCGACGLVHARALCPACAPAPAAAVREQIRARGAVVATRVYRTAGVLVAAAVDRGELLWLEHRDGCLRREDGTTWAMGPLSPGARVRLERRATLLGRDGCLVVLGTDQPPRREPVDSFAGRPVFDASGGRRFWLQAGRLLRDGPLGPERIGDVLAGQTRFWAGERFGLGLSRAGVLSVAFVFDADRPGAVLNDSVRLPPVRGRLVDADCTLDRERAWLLLTTRHQGRAFRHLFVVLSDGRALASAAAAEGEGGWLWALGGCAATEGFLLGATDAGVVRVEVDGGKLVLAREFPDTEPFVHAGCRLLVARQGLAVVDRQEIVVLRLS